jgi:hypothetical protein
MADSVQTRTSDGKAYTPHPEGQYAAVCVDVLDLGEHPESYKNQPAELKHKIALVFWTGEVNPDTGKPYEITREFTNSMGPKANLRGFLSDWRGKSYSEDEARKPVPLDKLEGVSALMTIEHKSNAAGDRTYANIRSIAPLPKGMQKVDGKGYQRAEFWAKRKAEYRTLADAWRATHQEFTDEPPPDDETEMPF